MELLEDRALLGGWVGGSTGSLSDSALLWPAGPVGTPVLELANRQSDSLLTASLSEGALADASEFENGTAAAAQVLDRQVFYNHSSFDNGDPAANAADDGAIAPHTPLSGGHGPHSTGLDEPEKELGKDPLLPGQTATFANYTSYSRGLNGIMIDVATLANPAALGAADFRLRVGNDGNPDGWAAPAVAPSVSVRAGAGAGGSDRVTLIWPDNAIQKQWLQVTVLATASTGLAQNDVFYFGNAIGESGSGNSSTFAFVTASDELGSRNHPHSFLDCAGLNDPYDFNRDSYVSVSDELLARTNSTSFLNALRLITVPSVVATDDRAATNEDTARAIDVLANDRDALGGPLSVYRLDAASALGATLTLNPDGTVQYDPTAAAALQVLEAGETLDDTFTYTICDARGGTATARVVVSVAGLDEYPRRYHAVIVGIADYPGTSNDLSYPDDDARDFRDALLAQRNWASENITLLVDSAARTSAIRAAIQGMGSAAEAGDVCVFYFSGHGGRQTDVAPADEADGLDEYLATYDGRILDDQLAGWLQDDLPTDNYVVFLDTCYSGGFAKGEGLAARGLGPSTSVEGDGFAADFTAGLSVYDGGLGARDLDDNGFGVVLTACNENELSWEYSSLQNGLFTYYLVQGMAGEAEANANSWISGEELFSYTAPRVTAYQSTQHPQLYDGHAGELDFLLLSPKVIGAGAATNAPTNDYDGDGRFLPVDIGFEEVPALEVLIEQAAIGQGGGAQASDQGTSPAERARDHIVRQWYGQAFFWSLAEPAASGRFDPQPVAGGLRRGSGLPHVVSGDHSTGSVCGRTLLWSARTASHGANARAHRAEAPDAILARAGPTSLEPLLDWAPVEGLWDKEMGTAFWAAVDTVAAARPGQVDRVKSVK